MITYDYTLCDELMTHALALVLKSTLWVCHPRNNLGDQVDYSFLVQSEASTFP